eukprot:scaffold888_cov246-Pinguiococcus_pyrenoidosus.AAC.13
MGPVRTFEGRQGRKVQERAGNLDCPLDALLFPQNRNDYRSPGDAPRTARRPLRKSRARAAGHTPFERYKAGVSEESAGNRWRRELRLVLPFSRSRGKVACRTAGHGSRGRRHGRAQPMTCLRSGQRDLLAHTTPPGNPGPASSARRGAVLPGSLGQCTRHRLRILPLCSCTV